MPTHRVACTILLLTAQVHGAVLFVDMLRNFSTCVSFKGGMSAWREFLLDLEGERNRDERHKWLLAGDGPEVRLVRDYHSFYSSVATPGWYHMRVIRDPVERLVSGYLDRCVRGKMHCGTMQSPTPAKLLEFVKFLNVSNTAFGDEHFRPQTSDCATSTQFNKTISWGKHIRPSLSDHLMFFCAKFDINASLCYSHFPVFSREIHATQHPPWVTEDSYAAKLESAVSKLYAKDMELYQAFVWREPPLHGWDK